MQCSVLQSWCVAGSQARLHGLLLSWPGQPAWARPAHRGKVSTDGGHHWRLGWAASFIREERSERWPGPAQILERERDYNLTRPWSVARRGLRRQGCNVQLATPAERLLTCPAAQAAMLQTLTTEVRPGLRRHRCLAWQVTGKSKVPPLELQLRSTLHRQSLPSTRSVSQDFLPENTFCSHYILPQYHPTHLIIDLTV